MRTLLWGLLLTGTPVPCSMPHTRPRKGRAAAGIEESHASREHDRERKRLADQYDGFDMRVRRLAVHGWRLVGGAGGPSAPLTSLGCAWYCSSWITHQPR